jgi:hypothetical protein
MATVKPTLKELQQAKRDSINKMLASIGNAHRNGTVRTAQAPKPA